MSIKLDYIKHRLVNSRGNHVINPTWSAGRVIGPSRIVVNHDAQLRPAGYSSQARYEAHARLHNTWGYGNIGMQYHIRIDNMGQIWLSREFEKILYHAGNWPINQTGIAICVDGYFHPPYNEKPTREQYEALKQTIDWLRGMFGISSSMVTGHRQHSGTVCPGNGLYPFVAAYRSSNGNPKIPNVPYQFPGNQPKDTPKPAPKPPKPSPSKITYTPIAPKTIELTKNTSLWNFNFTNWNNAKAIKSYKKGDRIEVVAIATNSLGGRYYMTDHSYYDGKIRATNGFNTTDAKDYIPPQPTPKPIPETPPAKPSDPVYKKNIDTNGLPAVFVANQDGVALRAIGTGKEVATYEKGHEFTMIQRSTTHDGKKYLMTEYSVEANVWNGVLESDLHEKTIADVPADHDHPDKDIDKRLTALEKLAKAITDWLDGLFKNWRK